MKRLAAVLMFAVLTAPFAEAGSFRIRARENFSTGKLDFGDGQGRLAHTGFASAFNIWYEEPFKHAAGLTVHRGRLTRVGHKESAAETSIGVEGKYFPMGKELPGFVRGGLLATAIDPAGPVKDMWNYGLSAAVGWEVPVWKLGIAPEVGGKTLWGPRGRSWQAVTIALGIHFYVFDRAGKN